MENNTASKRSRASAEQLSQMVDFMMECPGFASGKFQKLHGKFETDKKWKELSEMLNSLGGAVKTIDQWHTVWRDLKSRTSNKVRDRKKQQALTGNRPISQEPISEMEKRVVAVIGSEYIEGHDPVSENVPMLEELQLRLEDEDETVNLDVPSTSSTPHKPLELRWDTPMKNTPQRSTKRKRVKDAENETTKKFLEIANKQTDALKILGESTAEAIKVMADAIKVMGEGLKSTAGALNNLANAINSL